MTQLNRDQVLIKLKQLPSLPSAVSELMASFGDEDVDIAEIAHKISRDQGLTARVLRVANSSFYGLQSKVGTINDAVVVLGFRAVRSMVLAVGMNSVLRVEQCPGFEVQAYLRHCVGVGLAARSLAQLTGYNAELAFTGGILHDIGKLVLASNFSAQYTEVLAYRNKHDCFIIDAERDVLGMDHAQVGALLAEAWRFPPALHEAVAEHHAPAGSAATSLAALIHLADGLTHALGLAGSDDEMVMPVDATAWLRLGLDAEKLNQVFSQLLADLDETCMALNG